jgi:tRNA A-37 threonylcarbamoyl transferase component Bud32
VNFDLPPDPRVGTVLADRYRIDSVLGEGAMGKVYAAEHVLMRKRLAVKVLHRELSSVPELVARFEREAMAAANIDHPNIAGATDFGRLEDGAVFLALELVEGRCLRDEIAKGPIPPLRALHIARQIAAALGSAHALSIVHRDLKPENVMLVEKAGDPDFVKVLDFGVARVPIGEGGPLATGPITRAGMVFGTPEYIPPEQALGQASDGRADLYSLGVILFEMLTGSRPFTGETKVSLVGQHIGRPPPLVSERAPGLVLPEGTEALVARLLEKEGARRPQTAEEVVKATDRLLGRRPTRRPFQPTRRAPAKAHLVERASSRFSNFRATLQASVRAVARRIDAQRQSWPRLLARPLERVSSRAIAVGLLALVSIVLGLMLFAVGKLAAGRDDPAAGAASARGSATAPTPATAGATTATGATPASPTAAVSAANAAPAAAEFEAARRAGPAELAKLADRFPKDANVRLELARAQANAKDYVAAVKSVAAALPLDPSAKNDGRSASALFQAAQAKPSLEAAFALLEGPMQERGAAIAHDLAVFAPKGAPAQRRAEAFLASPRFVTVAEPPLRLAVAMRRATRCAEVRALLPEVKAAGDKHSLPYLKFFHERIASYPCLKSDTLLADATKAVEARVVKN